MQEEQLKEEFKQLKQKIESLKQCAEMQEAFPENTNFQSIIIDVEPYPNSKQTVVKLLGKDKRAQFIYSDSEHEYCTLKCGDAFTITTSTQGTSVLLEDGMACIENDKSKGSLMEILQYGKEKCDSSNSKNVELFAEGIELLDAIEAAFLAYSKIQEKLDARKNKKLASRQIVRYPAFF